MAEQPKNFGFGEDETMLRDSARKFFADHSTADKLHRLVAHDFRIDRPNESVWEPQLWQQMIELGWTAACVPEAAGGLGMPVVAAIALAEEVGRSACPSPLITTMAATFVLNACDTQAAQDALAGIAEGKATALAVTNQKGSWHAEDTDVTLSADGRLTGHAYFVQDARKCEQFVVSARSDQGVALMLVAADAEGLTLTPDAIIDLTRDQARLSFDGVEGTLVAEAGKGGSALEAALPARLCLVSADMVGAGEWLLQTTTEYAKTRVQFDRPLGFFQAVKHPLVNVMIQIDNAKSLTYNAACAIDHEPEKALQYARMAKSEASDMAVYASSRAVQFHGGIGFTWECYVHMFFKRQMHNQVYLGDAKLQRAHLADMVIGKAA
jgi:alkylation response protein AidB-like acyl-CoA dehydrogenase